jgi:hypothetical protein
MMAAQACAQSAAQPRKDVAAKSVASRVVAVTTIAAAGSVIVLADGIVANAAIAAIQPPADGFVYER